MILWSISQNNSYPCYSLPFSLQFQRYLEALRISFRQNGRAIAPPIFLRGHAPVTFRLLWTILEHKYTEPRRLVLYWILCLYPPYLEREPNWKLIELASLPCLSPSMVLSSLPPSMVTSSSLLSPNTLVSFENSNFSLTIPNTEP